MAQGLTALICSYLCLTQTLIRQTNSSSNWRTSWRLTVLSLARWWLQFGHPSAAVRRWGQKTNVDAFSPRCAKRVQLARSCETSASANMESCESILRRDQRFGQRNRQKTQSAWRKRLERHAQLQKDTVSG